MKKNRFLTIFSSLIILIFLGVMITECGGGKTVEKSEEKAEAKVKAKQIKPLNISVFLDLSDRLKRDLTPSQTERDSLIINNLMDLFIDDCIRNGKIINSKNHFQIFFHPAPEIREIATLSSGLNIDLSREKMACKKAKLKAMKDIFTKNISQIYQSTLTEEKWIGSDIWGFISNKKVDSQCIREGYRNILVILTDGYLYYGPNKVKDGNSYNYILPATLTDTGSSLIVKRNDLKNLEVLMLEVNPYKPLERDRLIEVLEQWFAGMEVSKFVVADTDMPVNTENIIRNFIYQNN